MTITSLGPVFITKLNSFNMIVTKNEKQAMSLTVTEGLTVTILPNSSHEFLMPTKEVAKGYGTSDYNIRQHKLEHSNELIEGKHFISGVSIPHVAHRGSSKGVLWTKRGIVRLGFFIKSERAKLFRDWAEELVINATVKNIQVLPEAPKRNHNRLTQERIIDILADVCRIDDRELRLSITAKIMGGQQ